MPIVNSTDIEHREYIVFAVRKKFTIAVDKAKDPNVELYENATIKYCPCVTPNGTARGVSIEDEKQIPDFVRKIGVSGNSPEWDSRVQEFYWDYEYPIKFGTVVNGLVTGGTRLNCSYKETNGVKIPVNLNDYMLYNMLIQDSKVSSDVSSFDEDNNYYEFYLVDISSEKKKIEEKAKVTKDVAIKIGALLASSDTEEGISKIKQIVGLLGIGVSSITAPSLSIGQCVIELQKIAAAKPEKLIAAIDDKFLASRLKANQLVDAGIITVSDDKYYYNEEAIGKYAEFIKFLSKSENKDVVDNMDIVLSQRIMAANLEEISSL